MLKLNEGWTGYAAIQCVSLDDVKMNSFESEAVFQWLVWSIPGDESDHARVSQEVEDRS